MTKKIYSVVLSLLLLFQPLLYGWCRSMADGSDVVFYTAFAALALIMAAMIARAFGNAPKPAANHAKADSGRVPVTLTITDILVGAYLLYGLLNAIFVRQMPIDPAWLVRWAALAGGYVLLRMLPDKRWALYALALSGVVQSLEALAQHFYLIESNHALFGITGSFGNPGQLGGYLAVCLIASAGIVVLAVRKKSAGMAVTGGIAAAVIIAGMVLADSRAGFFAGAVGVVMCLWILAGRVKAGTRNVLLITGVFALVIAGIFLIRYRPASAEARLLTWQVTAGMMAERPAFGYGVESFNDHYMLSQARYFEANPDSEYATLADNVSYPYNELLHVGAEQGIVGVILVIALFAAVFLRKPSSDRNRVVKAMLAGLLIFSMFSYPADVFPLMFLFAVLAGSADGVAFKEFKIGRSAYLTGLIPLFLALVWAALVYSDHRETSRYLAELCSPEAQTGGHTHEAPASCPDHPHRHTGEPVNNASMRAVCPDHPQEHQDGQAPSSPVYLNNAHGSCPDYPHGHVGTPVDGGHVHAPEPMPAATEHNEVSGCCTSEAQPERPAASGHGDIPACCAHETQAGELSSMPQNAALSCSGHKADDHNPNHAENYKAFRKNGVFRDTYLEWLAVNTDSADDLAAIAEITPNCELYCLAGDAFMRLGRHSDAGYYYLTASHMIPTRIVPKYKLWQLYIATGDDAKAMDVASRLLSQPLKVENTTTLRAKVEVSDWLRKMELQTQ